MRTRAYRRSEREKHIKRKENIIKSYAHDSIPYYYNASDRFNGVQYKRSPLYRAEGGWQGYWYVKHRGCLNKQKIHCSCALCSAKTRNKGKRRKLGKNYAPSINWKHTDIQKIESMKTKETLYNNNDDETKLFNTNNDIEYDISKEELLELISLISD